MGTPRKRRTVAYVDGFNLYFGLREKKFKRYYWLDVESLVRNLLRDNQVLVLTKYFTARISGGRTGDSPEIRRHIEAKRNRQENYLEAIGLLETVRIYEGHYLTKPVRCRQCGSQWRKPEEKMTDVNIATELLCDAFQDNFDDALLISGDSDLTPPILSIRKHFPRKNIIIAFPPRRRSGWLAQVASGSFMIGRGKLKASLFPDEITKPDGYVLRRPATWR